MIRLSRFRILLRHMRLMGRYYFRAGVREIFRLCPDCWSLVNITWRGRYHCPECGRIK